MVRTTDLTIMNQTYTRITRFSGAASEIANRREFRLLERVFWAGILVLMVADIVTTMIALPHPALVETNALAAWFIAAFGALPGLTLKMVALLAVGVPLSRRLPHWARLGMLTGVLGAHLVVVASNVKLLLEFGLL